MAQVIEGKFKLTFLDMFRKVLVTGPQRSGTAITSEIINYETNLELIREWEFGYFDKKLFKEFVDDPIPMVIQCSGLCRWIHEYDAKDIAVVLCRRNVRDIIASQERIEWPGEELELNNYGRKSGIISQIKYEFWEQHQRPLLTNPFEVEYESLKGHKLWVPKDKRKHFNPFQTKVEERAPWERPLWEERVKWLRTLHP